MGRIRAAAVARNFLKRYKFELAPGGVNGKVIVEVHPDHLEDVRSILMPSVLGSAYDSSAKAIILGSMVATIAQGVKVAEGSGPSEILDRILPASPASTDAMAKKVLKLAMDNLALEKQRRTRHTRPRVASGTTGGDDPEGSGGCGSDDGIEASGEGGGDMVDEIRGMIIELL